MKQTILVDLTVICTPPPHITRFAYSLKAAEKILEGWCRDMEDFIRDHRSRDDISLEVTREYEDRCSFCGREWEEDEDGMPTCCNKAQKEWELSNKTGS